MSKDFATDYIDVATRIAAIRSGDDKQYPEGSFQPLNHAEPFQVLTIEGTTYLAYVAAFYRTPDDTRPGVGSAWEQVPGRTPYTRGSELQNAETSAWGRALIAALAADTKKGIASADEVRNRQAEADEPPPVRTDLDWLTDVRQRLTMAQNVTEVEAIVAEARRKYHEGRLAADDAAVFKGETDQRLAELKPSLAVS